MAYTYSKTDWSNTDRMTFTEFNRIVANINDTFGTDLKDDYTQNDYVAYAEWAAILSTTHVTPFTRLINANYINAVERNTERARTGLYPSESLYPSDTLYPSYREV